MIQTNTGHSDKKVLNQAFKSIFAQNLNVEPINETVFDDDDYLIHPMTLPWFGSVGEGFKIKELFELFGYDVDWNGDKARVMILSNKNNK